MPKNAVVKNGWGWPVPQPNRPRRSRWRTVLGAVAVAFLGAFAGSLLTPGLPYRTAHAIARAIQGAPEKPPLEEEIVRTYVAQTRTAQFWLRRPTIFPWTVGYFRAHFEQLDPRQMHPYRESRFKLYIPELVEAHRYSAASASKQLGR